MSQNEAKRRPSSLQPGTPMLLGESVGGSLRLLREFSAASGIPTRDLLLSPMCAEPLPLYNFKKRHPGSRRWPDVRADFMWHPLMWLPQRLAGRYTYTDPDTGEAVREDDDLWAIRVALEVQTSGLYDADSATWVDMLDLIDVDVDDDLDQARVQDWLDGASDEDLDNLGHEMDEYLRIEPDLWSLEAALALRDDLREASWTLQADELASMLDANAAPAAEGEPPEELEARLTALSTVSGIAASVFRGARLDDDPVGPLDVYFAALHEQVAAGDDLTTAKVNSLASDATRHLDALREKSFPALERLHGLDAEGVDA